MARVRRQRTASISSAAVRHKQDSRKKAPYRVILEEVTQKKKLQTYLSFDAVAPRGYTFIPAGDLQLTKRCKQLSKKHGMTVYIVSIGGQTNMELSREVHRVGYHFSTSVVDEACQTLGVTLNASGRVIESHFASLRDNELQDQQVGRRAKARKNKRGLRNDSPKIDMSLSQAVIDTQAREAIEDLFPKIPRLDLHEIVSRAFDKTRNLVGTASGTSLVRRANLAVVAHIRHTYTNYDELLRSGVPWFDARRGVEQFTLDKLVSWRGDDDDGDDDIMEDVLREVVVISDDEADTSDIEGEERGTQSSLRDQSVEVIPPEDIHTEAIDLTTIDDDNDSDEDATIPYRALAQTQHVHPYDQDREVRMGQQRHVRWEEAVSRHRTNPNRAQHDPAVTRSYPDQTFTRLLLSPRGSDGRSAASTDRVSVLRPYRYRVGDDTERGNHVIDLGHGQSSAQAQRQPSRTYDTVNSNGRYRGLLNDDNRQLNLLNCKDNSRLVEATKYSGDMDSIYLPCEPGPIPFHPNPDILPSVENDAQDQHKFERDPNQQSTFLHLGNPKIGSFSTTKASIAHHDDVRDGGSLKRRHADDVQHPSGHNMPHPHEVKRDGRTVLIPLDQPKDRGSLRSDVDQFCKTSGGALVPVPHPQLQRPLVMQRQVLLDDRGLRNEDGLRFLPQVAEARPVRDETSSLTSADHERLLPSNVFEAPRLFTLSSSKPQVPGIIRRRCDDGADVARSQYGRLTNADNQAHSKQVICLGATSMHTASLRGTGTQSNRQTQQPVSLVNRQCDSSFPQGAQQDAELRKQNPFGERAPQRNPEAGYNFQKPHPELMLPNLSRHPDPKNHNTQQHKLLPQEMPILLQRGTSNYQGRPALPDRSSHSHSNRQQPREIIVLDGPGK